MVIHYNLVITKKFNGLNRPLKQKCRSYLKEYNKRRKRRKCIKVRVKRRKQNADALYRLIIEEYPEGMERVLMLFINDSFTNHQI